MWASILAGATVAAFNGLMAWWLAAWSLSKDSSTFMMAVLGGMGARLVLMIAVSVALLKFTSVRPMFYLGALMVVFFILQALEIVFLLKSLRRERGSESQV
jgi:hypothetical protein